jgi:thioesterase domain-containing protein
LIAYEMAQQLTEMGHEVRLVAMLETYYSRRRANLTPMRRADRLLQNLTFHAENLFSLDTKGKATFMREKLEVAVGRARGRSRLLLSRFSPLRRVANDADSLYIRLTRENDRALGRYVAAPYSGRVVLFRPNRVFRGNDDPSFGWHELVGDHLEVRKLPIAPRGMLVEPLVRVLADQLRVCIDQTLFGRDVRPRQGLSPEAGKSTLENQS